MAGFAALKIIKGRIILYLKKNIYIMYAIALLQGMVFYGPIATLYRQAAGVTIYQITLIESASLVLIILLELPWGLAADRIGYRRTMIICCGLYFVSKLIFWRAEGFGGFLLERLLLSVVCAGLSGVETGLLYLSCREGESQRAFGIYNSLAMTGLLLASVTYSVFIGDNYRLAGLMTVISYGCAALLALGLKEVKVPKRRKEDRVWAFGALLRGSLGNKSLMLLVVSAALLGEAHQTITVFLNQLQYARAGMSASAIALVYGAVTLAGSAGILSARITNKLGERKTGLWLFLASAGSCLVLAMTKSALLSVLAILLLRVCHSLFQPLQTELQNRHIHTEDRAAALSVNSVLMDSIAVFTNLVFGRLAEIGLGLSMLFGCLLCVTGLVLYSYRSRLGRGRASI